MKALVLQAYDVLDNTEVPLPRMAPGEVLIRMKACGICASDVHGVDGSARRRIPPHNHETRGRFIVFTTLSLLIVFLVMVMTILLSVASRAAHRFELPGSRPARCLALLTQAAAAATPHQLSLPGRSCQGGYADPSRPEPG